MYNERGAASTAEDCRAVGAEVFVSQADVADDNQGQALVEAAIERFRRLDVLVNDAGTTKFHDHGHLQGLDAEDFMHIHAVNAIGPYQMIRAAEPGSHKSENAAMVNVSSVAGITGMGSSISHAASRGALITMTKSLARTLDLEIWVNAICPGFIEGDWLKRGLGEECRAITRDHWTRTTPLQAVTTPEVIAESIVYFANQASLVTGETPIVDAGWHLQGSFHASQ